MDELRKEHRQQQRLHGQQQNDNNEMTLETYKTTGRPILQQLRMSTGQCLRYTLWYANPKFQAIQKPRDQHMMRNMSSNEVPFTKA